MARKRRTRTRKEPEPKPPSGRDLKARAEALLLTSKALLVAAQARAVEKAAERGDRVAGFVGPTANADGTVAAQTEED